LNSMAFRAGVRRKIELLRSHILPKRMNDNIKLDTIEEAIEAIKNGEIIIVVDDEGRENEGDFICAAEKTTPDIINFMAKEGRGLICAPLSEER